MILENASSNAAAAASATGSEENKALTDDPQKLEAAPEEDSGDPKKEKTPEEREIARMRRRIDALTRKNYEQAARFEAEKLTFAKNPGNTTPQDDGERLSLSRAELQQLVEQHAKQLAPAVRQQESEVEHRQAVVSKLASEWGPEKFDAYSTDLEDALGGLHDDQGRVKPAMAAIFESEAPRAVIEYLADPDNANEAADIARMGAVQAGRAVAKIEAKLSTKPQPSKAKPPIESVRGQGTARKNPTSMTSDEFAKWRKSQIAAR